MERSQHSNSTSTSLSSPLNTEDFSSPKLHHHHHEHDLIKTLSYPREVTIASTPMKLLKSSVKAKAPFALTQQPSQYSAASKAKQLNKSKIEHFDTMTHAANAHTNYAFETTQNTGLSNTSANSSMSDASSTSSASSTAASTNVKADAKINLRRESSQLLPQSIANQMVRNLQSLTYYQPQCMQLQQQQQQNGVNPRKYSADSASNTQNIAVNASTTAEQSHLKDEDAWLPILNIVEEQVLNTNMSSFLMRGFGILILKLVITGIST